MDNKKADLISLRATNNFNAVPRVCNMKLRIIVLLLITFLSACGGGGSSEVAPVYDGVWAGYVNLEKDCETIGPPAEDVTAQYYEFRVVTQDDTDGFGFRDLFVTDSLGNTYSGDIVGDQAVAHNDLESESDISDGLVETGPSNITFSNIQESSADIQLVNVGGSRFCADVYIGVFERIE